MGKLNTMKEYAHYYVDHTPFRVFPVAAGDKVPLAGSHGFYDATRDHDEIDRLWTDPNYNIAAATGDGLMVIDLDCKHEGENGLETLHELEHDAGMIPETTWTAMTTTGGVHIYFHTDLEVGTDNHDTYPDIDVHGSGSYIILPPSRLRDGKCYQWEIGYAPGECDLAEANDAVKKLFIDIFNADDKPHKERFKMPLEKIGKGLRNSTLFKAACFMQSAGFPDSAIEAAIECTNRDLCDPSVSDRELRRILESALEYEKGGKFSVWMKAGKIQQREILENLKAQLTERSN